MLRLWNPVIINFGVRIVEVGTNCLSLSLFRGRGWGEGVAGLAMFVFARQAPSPSPTLPSPLRGEGKDEWIVTSPPSGARVPTNKIRTLNFAWPGKKGSLVDGFRIPSGNRGLPICSFAGPNGACRDSGRHAGIRIRGAGHSPFYFHSLPDKNDERQVVAGSAFYWACLDMAGCSQIVCPTFAIVSNILGMTQPVSNTSRFGG